MGKAIVLTDRQLKPCRGLGDPLSLLGVEVYETLIQAQLEDWMLKLGPQTFSPLF